MATVVVPPTAAARPAPSSSDNNTGKIKGLEKARLRAAGVTFNKPEELRAHIYKLILNSPKTPGQIKEAIGGSDERVRLYCKALAEEGKIEKEGAYWKVKGAAQPLVQKERFDDIVKKSAFAQLPIMQGFVTHMRELKRGQWHLARVHGICTGRYVKTFKCRPEHWTPETTPLFVQAWKDYKGKDRLDMATRQALRYLHEYVLLKPVTDQQKAAWGIDGKKDVIGKHSHVRMTEMQIRRLADYYLNKGDLQTAAYVSGGIECFGRPEAMYRAETNKFTQTEITITKALIEGWPEPIYDNKFIPLLQALSVKDKTIKIERVRTDVYEGQLYEGKTEDLWPKRILGKQAVKIFAEWQHERRNNPRLFGDSESYVKWTHRMTPLLKEGYTEVGLTQEYFYKKPLYALRHTGAQMWLARTGYDYAGVAEMGWRDIATLHRWYGGYSFEFFMQKVQREYS